MVPLSYLCKQYDKLKKKKTTTIGQNQFHPPSLYSAPGTDENSRSIKHWNVLSTSFLRIQLHTVRKETISLPCTFVFSLHHNCKHYEVYKN